jgi:pSer/pThr/pTyr-binding forkhead associated (FHA) protein
MTGAGAGLRLLAAQNYNAILRPLQWAVIVVIFLFFLRVVRAVWVEVRPAGPRPTRAELRRQARDASVGPQPPPKRRKQLFLQLVEPAEHQGERYGVEDQELTIGRSPGCGIPTTYDVYSSTLHARVFRRGDQLWLEDLGSTNGTYLNSERVTSPTRLGKGDLVQVGASVFEVVR